MALGRRFSRNGTVLCSRVRRLAVVSSLARASGRICVAAALGGLVLIGANDSLQTASAEGDTRTLSFHHVHTGENITVTFKRDGRYDEAALKKLDWFMRDWRKNQGTHMDPHLFDLLWEVNRDVGGKQPIEVICGYRSPGTNAMLRERSVRSGVAQNSEHIQGQAIDFEIPGVPLEKILDVGLRLQRGGVGFYPTSGSPFVHMDTGTVRHWPRLSREQLVKVFPNGRTVHIPSDGQPLPGYALALADIEARGKEPNDMSLEAARKAGIDVASIESRAQKSKPSFLARLFGSGRDGDGADDAQAARQKPDEVASLNAGAAKSGAKPNPKPKQVAAQHVVPLPAARPKPIAVAMAQASPAAGNTMFDNRGIWTRAVESGELPPAVAAPSASSAADPATTASTGEQALAYAADVLLPEAAHASVGPTLAARVQAFAPQLTSGSERSDSPWLRAAMLTPSISGFMTASPMGAPHMRRLEALLHKPDQTLAMTFSRDPHVGMVSERFTGSAVVFLATATFTRQRTAALP
jgi:uncharacterized protein YcbK (DUF882 family)